MLVVKDQTFALFPTSTVFPCLGFCYEATGQGLALCWVTHVLRAQLLSRVRLCDPVDCSPPASSVQGVLQGRILEWAAISSSRGSSGPGVEPGSPLLQVDSSLLSHQGSPVVCVQAESFARCGRGQCRVPGVIGCKRSRDSGISRTAAGLYGRRGFSFCHQVVTAAGASSVGHFVRCGFFEAIVTLLPKSPA